MTLTARQQDVLDAIESGIKFLLSEYPNKRYFKVGEVMTAAGHDKKATKLYGVIKALKIKGKTDDLLRIKEMFARVNIKLDPLEEWFDRESRNDDSSFSKLKFDETALDMNVVDDAEAGIELENDLDSESSSSPVSVSYHEVDFPYTAESIHTDDIDILARVLKILAPLSRHRREKILESAESFYSIHR